MMHAGLGTRLRKLLAILDGDVQQLYAAGNGQFRPKYFPVVQALLEHGELDVLSLAATAQVTQPAMTQTLQEMERTGLLNLVPGSDRRQRFAELTEAGRATAAELTPLWRAVASAASALDRELPVSLDRAVDEALAALDRKPFRTRIEEELR